MEIFYFSGVLLLKSEVVAVHNTRTLLCPSPVCAGQFAVVKAGSKSLPLCVLLLPDCFSAIRLVLQNACTSF